MGYVPSLRVLFPSRLTPSASKRRNQERPETLEPVDVAIVCESTYPYLTGGLSAVVHQICESDPEQSIGIIHIAWDRDSPQEPLYDMPPNVKWVYVVYQALSEHRTGFQLLTQRDLNGTKRERAQKADQLIMALQGHLDGSDDALWQLYDEAINPLTRTWRLWPLLSTREFMIRALNFFRSSRLSFTELFWVLREFFSLAYAVTDAIFPKATVYHAHTTGAAGLLAAAAARQHDGMFLLTEHNLYTRDTVNHLLERSMDIPVTLNEWRELESYDTAPPNVRHVELTNARRAWMAWWIRTGVVVYRAADEITYLYPEAINEAQELGGDPSKSTVLPNGINPSHFDEARAQFTSRQQAEEGTATDRIWKLAYAARVVPIKGLLDLLQTARDLLAQGVDNWELDVMGPDGEMPDYVELCRQRCTEYGLDGRVKFLGSVNLRERFGYYDMLILPSHNEGQPIVVLEAMTMGLPTVGTYVGGMKQLVEDPCEVHDGGKSEIVGPCGVLVEAHDFNAMTRELKALLRDHDRFVEYSNNARRRAAGAFHIVAAMERYSNKYRDLRQQSFMTRFDTPTAM